MLALASIAGLGVLSAELVLRSRGGPVAYTALFVDDDSLGYACAPNLDAPVRSGVTRAVRSDASGVSDRSAGGVPNVVLLGDAVIAGLELDERARLAHRLGTALRRPTVNLACPGYGTLQEALVLRRWANRVAREGIVVVAFNLTSDVVDNVPEWDGPNVPGIEGSGTKFTLRLPRGRSLPARWVATLAKASRLYGAFTLRQTTTRNPVMMPQQRWLFDEQPPAELERGLSALTQSARLLQRTADSAGLRVIPVLWVDWGAVPGPDRAAAAIRGIQRVEERTGWRFANSGRVTLPADIPMWERRMFAPGTRHASREAVDSISAEIQAVLPVLPDRS